MSRRFSIVLVASVAAACVAASAVPGDGGPSPGAVDGGSGVSTRDGRTHYVTLAAGGGTVVEAIDRHGSVLRWNWLPGSLGIPLVANDGTAGGLSRDGRHLVLASYAGSGVTQFSVLSTKTFVAVGNVTLRGTWSFDALSPDARTLYLIQYFLRPTSQRYLVRVYDLARDRLYGRAVTARTERGTMTGWPVTRATSADGVWAYTLYVKGTGSAFVHALDTVHRRAVCVDLPWKDVTAWVYDARLWLSRDGAELHLRQRGIDGRTAVIDTRNWKVRVSSPV